LGLGTLHLGTDGGGSIRIPASFCGVFGFKPTFGVVSVHPHSPALNLWHQGPLTRTVSDAALMLTVMAGPDIRDWYAGPELSIDYRKGLVMASKNCASLTAGRSAMPSQIPTLSVWSIRQLKIWFALERM
jgi:aspartyl-tRNA(Asn)/glutamyl-tRNA(Gln) amidotransferase subunit A